MTRNLRFEIVNLRRVPPGPRLVVRIIVTRLRKRQSYFSKFANYGVGVFPQLYQVSEWAAEQGEKVTVEQQDAALFVCLFVFRAYPVTRGLAAPHP